MAAIAHKLLFAVFAFALTAAADQARDVLKAINHVATALTGGNPSDAMLPFDKSCPNYTTIQNNFIGLTDVYQVSNEANVMDEQDLPTETTLTLQWTLNLTNKGTHENINRTAEVHLRLRSERGRWKIIEFSPVDLFNLAAK
ncbi:MAG: hypothetical protein M3Y27_03680 [Acidobacteriota bacterium]|nr:hypothetical protein [Acidobacteriota bacterium]